MAKNMAAAPAVPDFYDVDTEAVKAAQASLSGGNTPPLQAPAAAIAERKESKGTYYTRWVENVNITAAYRSVTKKGLMDIAIGVKVRQSEDNSGKKAWFHFYMKPVTPGVELSDGHTAMNERTIGALSTLLVATGYMPTSGSLKATLLAKMFPQKNQPGAATPLIGKNAIAVIVQQEGPKKEDGKVIKDAKGNVTIEQRDSAEKFLPEIDEDEDDTEE